MAETRTATLTRETQETKIALRLNVDGAGDSAIATGIPFFDHMLTLFARHGMFDIDLKAEGDVDVDYHHTVEDIGIVLGQGFREALGERRGITRYGFWLLPMDEALAQVAVDLSNRPFLVYSANCSQPMVRDFNVGLVREFCQAWVGNAGANLHINLLYGDEPHHVAEAIFKGMARALDQACQYDSRLGDGLPSTKGLLS